MRRHSTAIRQGVCRQPSFRTHDAHDEDGVRVGAVEDPAWGHDELTAAKTLATKTRTASGLSRAMPSNDPDGKGRVPRVERQRFGVEAEQASRAERQLRLFQGAEVGNGLCGWLCRLLDLHREQAAIL